MSEQKHCTKCKQEFAATIEFFYRNKHQKFRPDCKVCCRKSRRQQYKKRRKKILEYQKEYRQNHREKLKLHARKYRKEQTDAVKAVERKRRKSPKYRCRVNEYYRKSLRENNDYKIKRNLRGRILKVLKGESKSKSTLELLGCSVEYLKQHLESQFTEDMSWDNYGVHGWHIDHIKPCALFDLNDINQQEECFSYTNLQPLWAKDNLSKGSKYES